MIHPDAVSQFQHPVFPVRRGPVVDAVGCPELLGAFELGVAAGGNDGFGARDAGELQGEDRYAASAEHKNGVTGLHSPLGHQALPCRHRGAGQGGCLFIRQVVGCVNEAVLVQDDVFRQHAVDGAAQGRRGVCLARFPGQPGLHEDAHDPVPRFDAADLRSDFDDFSRPVGQRDERQLHAASAAVLDGHQIAVIQRRGLHPHPRLARLQGRILPFTQLQVVDAEGVTKFHDFHSWWFPPCPGKGCSCRAQIVA